MVLETAAETPPIKNSIKKVVTLFFFSVWTGATGVGVAATGAWVVAIIDLLIIIKLT